MWIYFFAIIFYFASWSGESEIVPGQRGLNKKKDKDITNLFRKI